MNKSPYIVIQSTQPPYSSSCSIDALEAALAATNIGLEVMFIFVGEGVYQLLDKQENSAICHKSTFKKLKALPLFDIDKIFALHSSLIEHSVSLPIQMPNISAISDTELIDYCKQANHVLVF
jgi:tRNA 2-thiouridine synthesizing protein C